MAYSEYVFEYLEYPNESMNYLKESFRVLKPQDSVSIGVLDFEWLTSTLQLRQQKLFFQSRKTLAPLDYIS